jgi:protein-S-isoprenylcysteine O-methyltransferase Ste14
MRGLDNGGGGREHRAMPSVSARGLAAAFTNLSVAGFYVFFAYAHGASFAAHPRASVAIIVVVEALFALFVLLRRDAERSSLSLWDWLTTLVGTVAPLGLRPGAGADQLAGQVLQVLGGLLAVHAIATLNRSIGLVPALRGIKRHGPYRWVRHPLYAAYVVSCVGYLLNNLTARNASIVVLSVVLWVLRIANEERFLSRYPEYAAYSERTRWRLIPFVF